MNTKILKDQINAANYPGLETPEKAYEAINDLLAKKLTSDAYMLLRSSIKLWPQDNKLRLLKVDVLFATKTTTEAINYFMTLLDVSGLEIWAISRLSKGLMNAKNIDGELHIRLVERVKDLKVDRKYLDQLLISVSKSCHQKDRLAVLKLISRATDNWPLKCQYAVELFNAGRLESALEWLESMHLNMPGTSISLLIHANLLSTKGNFLEAIQLLERDNYKNILDAHCFRLLISLKQVEMQFAEAADLLEFCLDKWPEDWILIFRLNRSPLPHKKFQSIYKKMTKYWDEILHKEGKLGYQYAITCMQAGEVQKSKNILMDILGDPTCGYMAKNLLDGLNQGKFTHSTFENHRFRDDRCSDFQVVESLKPSATVIIVFAMNSINDWPLEMIDSSLEDLNCNVIYFRDFKRKAFLGGVNSIGGTEKETLAKLEKILKKMGVDRIITIGASFCGYAAIKYGALLHADHVLSLSGPNNLQTYYEDTPISVWNYLYFIKLKMQRAEYFESDLVPLIARSTDTTFHQFYGEKHSQDTIQARSLMGLSNVCIMPLKGFTDHSVGNLMISDGTLFNYLKKLI